MFLPRGILKLALCAAMEKTRYAMEGIAIERTDKGHTKVTCTDGKRLVRAELDAPFSVPDELVNRFAHVDSGKRIPLIVLPTNDAKGPEGTVIKGIASLVRDERSAVKDAKRKNTRIARPVKPARPAKVKRITLEKLPPLPKRARFIALAGETADATLARFKREMEAAREERKRVRALNADRRTENKRRAEERKASIANDRKAHDEALIAWRKARREARKARDVVALYLPSDGMTVASLSLSPGRAHELRAVEGFYPPVDDVMPKANRVNSHEVIIDTKALMLIVAMWNATIAADERALMGAQGIPSRVEIIRLTLQGRNARVSARVIVDGRGEDGVTFVPSESQTFHSERWLNVVRGEGECIIGFNAAFLSEMSDALHSAIGSTAEMSGFVRLGIKSENDAILVAPCMGDERGLSGETFAPSLRGVKVSGLLMPVNLDKR